MLNERHKEFIKLIEGAARSRSVVDVFGDAVHLMAQSLWKPCIFNKAEADDVEADWQRTRDRYTDEEYQNICKAFAVVMEALEHDRKEFLGIVLEHIGASNTRNGQFLTPECVARMMAKCLTPNVAEMHKDGEIISVTDPSCGASVLLIEQAEQLLQAGIPKSDIFLIAGDIDQRACDMSYINLSVLGYAAKVERQDALAMKEYSKPRYTIGYFMHGLPMRGVVHGRLPARCVPQDSKLQV
jgi:type I restriction-modification system DNA methylase subunit